MIKPDSKPACKNEAYDPDWWFIDQSDLKIRYSAKEYQRKMADITKALEICSTCPLFADGSCLEYAMQDQSTIDFGIYGGTLPVERRAATGSEPNMRLDAWQIRVRKAAESMGLIKPYIARKERPKSSLYLYIDSRALIRRDSDLSEWE